MAKKHITPKNHEIGINEGDFLVSKTDTRGIITYCNIAFMKTVGAKESELLGKPHNIVRHPDMPKAVFKLLWDRVQRKEEIFAFVKNLTFDGSYYWVYANVTASLDSRGNIVGYYSVRRKMNESIKRDVDALYAEMRQRENSGGIEAGMKYLENLLNEKGVSYDEFVISLQG
jgi:PAS domain S-box-containing protein